MRTLSTGKFQYKCCLTRRRDKNELDTELQTLHGSSSLRKSLFRVAVLFVVLGLFSCNPWGELNNPADIKSDYYQGFEVSATADGIKPYSPANGATLTDPPVEYVVSLVTRAEAYHIQISTTSGFEAPLVLDKSDYATNKMSPGSADMRTGGTLYWRARAKKSETWGAWTTVWSFSLPRKYIVSYDGNGNTGGNIPVDGNRYLPGASVTVLGNTGTLTKTGFELVGWNTAADESGTNRAVGTIFAMRTGNVVLYAQWSPTYKVTYDGNVNTGGTVPVDENRYLTGASVTVLGNTGSLEKTGYSFVGWNTAANGSGTDRAIGSIFALGSGNVVLYAKWTALPTYTVTYNGNGNTGGVVPIDANRYWTGLSVTVLGKIGSLEKTGHAFAGWNTSANGSGTDRVVGSTFAMGSANVVLYAKWTALPTYSVTYNGNGNTGGNVPVDSNRYWIGLSVTVLGNTGSIVKTGYDFDGWNTAANGTGTDYSVGSTFAMVSTNVVLYAKWAALPTYSVTYNGNGNTGGSIPIDVNRYWTGRSVTIMGNTGSLVKAGYVFDGWNTAANGSGTDHSVGLTFAMGTVNMVLYAKWAKIITMATVPGGSFQFGSEVIGTPVHQVSLSGFQMGIYEVTQTQYLLVTSANPSYFNSGADAPTRPVEQVTWYDAVEFCNKLSVIDGFSPVYMITGRTPGSGFPITSATVTPDMTKNGYRLPTEAEWEYTARGGNGSPGGYSYSGSNDIGTVAWYMDNSGERTHTVGLKAANGLGLYDMCGNLHEWCQDWWGGFGSDAPVDPTCESSGTTRVIRGGSYFDGAYYCQSACPSHADPGHIFGNVGFRVVRRP